MYIVQAVGLFSGSIGVWLHHLPYLPFTAALVATMAAHSPVLMSVSSYASLCLSLCLAAYVCLSACLYVYLYVWDR